MNDRLFLRGIELFAHHGLFDEEAKLGQRFIVDLDWWLDVESAARNDDFGQAVSYQDIFDTVHAVSSAHRYKLIEAFAEAIAEQILERYERVQSVRVELHKPGAPISGIFRDVGVEITRRRVG